MCICNNIYCAVANLCLNTVDGKHAFITIFQSKLKAKTGEVKYQWQIMASLGMTDDEIKEFADPLHWLKYFPPHCVGDLKRMGLKVGYFTDQALQLLSCSAQLINVKMPTVVGILIPFVLFAGHVRLERPIDSSSDKLSVHRR